MAWACFMRPASCPLLNMSVILNRWIERDGGCYAGRKVPGTILASKSRISACTSGSLRIASSAARWRASAAILLRRAGLSITTPISIASATPWPRVANADCNFSRLAGWLSVSRSTRSTHWSTSRAMSCDCSASSRAERGDGFCQDHLRDRRVPEVALLARRNAGERCVGIVATRRVARTRRRLNAHRDCYNFGSVLRSIHGRCGPFFFKVSRRCIAHGEAVPGGCSRRLGLHSGLRSDRHSHGRGNRRSNRRGHGHRRTHRRARRSFIQSFFFRGARGLEGQEAQQHHRERRVLVGRQAQFTAAVQAKAVEQLRLVLRHQCRKARGVGRIGVGRVRRRGARGHGLQHRHRLQHRGHFLERGCGRHAVAAQRFRRVDHRLAVADGERLDELEHMAAVDAAEHLAHAAFEQLAVAESDRLVGERQRIAHRTARRTREQAQRLRLGRHLFGLQHADEVFKHRLGRHRPEVELQAARQHRDRHLLRIGRREHELEVLGRLLERLQHRVERGVGEHVHFVDHEDLEAALHRLIDGLLQQRLHLVHAAVRCGIELGVVDEAARVDIAARLAHAARRGGNAALPIRALAVERLREDARHRRLAHAARAGEEISVVQALTRERVFERLHHMLLTDHFAEGFRTELAGEHEIGHWLHSKSPHDTPWRSGLRDCTCAAWVKIQSDGPPRMVKRPTGSGGEPSSPNCVASAGGKARQPHINATSPSRLVRRRRPAPPTSPHEFPRCPQSALGRAGRHRQAHRQVAGPASVT